MSVYLSCWSLEYEAVKFFTLGTAVDGGVALNDEECFFKAQLHYVSFSCDDSRCEVSLTVSLMGVDGAVLHCEVFFDPGME